MDINFVLNDCPTSSAPSRSADITFNIEGIGSSATFKTRPQNSESPSTFSHSSTTTTEHHLSQLVSTYTPYQHSNNPSTISSRSSYSGPSLQSSTAATSPLEIPMAPHHSAASANVDNAYPGNSEVVGSTMGPGSSFPGRLLPPPNSVNPHPPAPSSSGEGALSPRSTSHPYHHQVASDAGSYFSPALSHPYAYGSQYQPPVYSPSQQSHGHGYDTLLSFAEVAMGTATPSGRRSLEVEAAAAEALASRRDSGGSLRHSDPGTRSSSNHIIGSNNQQFQIDIDPELRPASPGSVASTGRTIEEEAPVINIGDTHPLQAQISSMATHIIDNRDTPLFRPTPEISTPRQEPVVTSADAGPSTNAGTGPLHIPSSPHDFLNQAPKCSYCSICTTGSPLRKVVSHIFGRNKLSTRQIPKNVWVYYCRKHYQRSRYRNPRGFARQQVLLVRRQCERLELWGGVKDWVIKVRRREELRMNREGGENGDEVDDVEDELEDNTGGDDEPEPNDGGPTSGESSRRNSTATTRRRSSTGGNNWIMRHTGMEKTIRDIYRLLERIEVEVQDNGGKFPDVELLPNVDLAMAVPIRGPDGDGDEGGSGNTGGNENQEGADDDGVAGRTIGKKRRRSDGGSGSSGGDDARGTKKAKSTAVKKGSDRKGKGKAPSHTEAAPSEKVLSQSKGAYGFHGAYQRAFSPEVPHQHEVDGMVNVMRTEDITVFTGRDFEHQIATPPPSTSASTERSTPEPESESATESNTPQNPIAGDSYVLSRRSARILPSAITIDVAKKALPRSSIDISSSKTYIDLTPGPIATISRTGVFVFGGSVPQWQR